MERDACQLGLGCLATLAEAGHTLPRLVASEMLTQSDGLSTATALVLQQTASVAPVSQQVGLTCRMVWHGCSGTLPGWCVRSIADSLILPN